MADAAEALPESKNLRARTSKRDSVLTALQRLDRLLEWTAAAAQAVYGPKAASVPTFRVESRIGWGHWTRISTVDFQSLMHERLTARNRALEPAPPS
jgi:hypothetical protein